MSEITNPIVAALFHLAELGDTQGLGKSVLKLDSLEQSHLEAFTRILLKGNAEHVHFGIPAGSDRPFVKSSVALIEALFQRRKAVDLAKVAFLSWKSLSKSPLSVRCLESAAELGPLDTVLDFAHHNLSNNIQLIEPASHLILKLAEAGCADAFFISGEILRDGDGVPKDLKGAAKWFFNAAYRGSMRAVTELSLVPEAFSELAKLAQNEGNSESADQQRDFYLHQAEIARKACQDLSALMPGDEIKALVEGDESATVEFKECANKADGVLQAIAAFLNTKGGHLFIGVTTDRKGVGLEKSYKELNVPNRDSFERNLVDRIRTKLVGHSMLDIKITYPPLHGHEICRIKVAPSKAPVFVKENCDESFYVRTGNSKRKLPPSELKKYFKERGFE